MCSKDPVLGLIEKLRDFFADVLYYWLIVMFLSGLFLPFGGLLLLNAFSFESLLNLANEWMCVSAFVTLTILYLELMLTAMKMLLEGCMDKISRLLILVVLAVLVFGLYLIFTNVNCCFVPG